MSYKIPNNVFSGKMYDNLWLDYFILRSTKMQKEMRRRLIVKEVVSAIEGTTYALKQSCLSAIGRCDVGIVFSHYLLLEDNTATIGNNGEVVKTAKYYPTGNNVKFAIRAFIKYHKIRLSKAEKSKLEFIFTNIGNVLKIRNRIVHPKSAAKMLVSDAEFDLVHEVASKYEKLIESLIWRSFALSVYKNRKYRIR